MNREIKYKFWCDRQKKMSDGMDLNTIVFSFDKGIQDYNIPLQFTGLKDKNGVEIYEGDILKHNNNTYIVKFSENQFCLLVKIVDSATNWRSLEWVNNVQKYISVIGNIYQNPELLTINK